MALSNMFMGSSISGLLNRLSEAPPTSASEAKQWLEEADILIHEVGFFADFEHSPADSYGRRVIAEGPGYELLAMSWLPGDASAIHDHGRAEWGAVRVYGPAEHAVFRLDKRELSLSQVELCLPGDILEVPPDLIHQMSNPGDQPFMTLHLYGRIGLTGSVTGSARVFDLDEDRVLRTDGGVFFALPPEAIVSSEPGVAADEATRYRHDRMLLERIRRIRAARLVRPDLADTYRRYLGRPEVGA